MEQKIKSKMVHIAILDTGCSLVHPLFSELICDTICAEGISDAVDRCGHGTFSLSVIVRSIKMFSDITYKVTSIKVSDEEAIDMNILTKGMEYCNQINPDVIYIGSCSCSFHPKMASILNDLAQKGIIIVVPSGNYAFCEPTYPSCLETTLSCGIANKDETICTEVNTYKVDAFVKCTNSIGVLSEECARSMGVKLNSEGMCSLVATSFAAAEMAAFACVIKSHWSNINVYSFRRFIQKNSINLVIQDFKKLFSEMKKESSHDVDHNLDKIMNRKEKYIFLESPKDMDILKEWKFTLYTYDGVQDTSSGVLEFELYDDWEMRHIVYKDKIPFDGGRGYIATKGVDLEPGIYLMRLGNKHHCIESDMSIMALRPEKPKLVCENGMVFAAGIGNNIKILYTENGSMPVIGTGKNTVGTTKLYTEPIKQGKGTMIFCTYYNKVFSEPVVLRAYNGGESHGV